MTPYQHRKTDQSSWKRQKLRLLVGTLLLMSILLCLLPMSSSHATPQIGGHGEILLGEVATDDPPGYFCSHLLTVLSQFHFFVDTNGPLPVIGVPPDYTKGQSSEKSGILTDSAQNQLADLFPPHDAQKHQAIFRYDSPYKVARDEKICASNTEGKKAIQDILDQFYGYDPNTRTTGPSISRTNDKGTPDPVQWMIDGMTGLWDYLWKQVVTFIQVQIIDYCNDFGFIWITPAALSYKNPLVQAGAAWAMTALDGYVALLLVLGGYQALINQSLGLEERSSALSAALRVLFTALIANTGFFLLLPSIVELSNSMSMGIMVTMLLHASGDLSLPLGGINWLELPTSWGLFVIISFVVSLLFIAVEAVRLAVLDVAIMFSPLWIMALSNEYSRAWGRFGALTFFSALFMQPIQIACLSLGAGLIANFGHFNPVDSPLCRNVPAQAHDACIAHLGNASLSSSMNIVVLVLGIATLYVAIKIPGMLFSNALRASVGSVNRDMAGVARTAMNFMFIQSQLRK
jgi:hypothetical protein